jgi:YVTN family beta-propeller protein
MKIKNINIVFTFSMVLLLACQKENQNTLPGSFEHGVIISNEGAFQNGNASVSFYDPSLNKMYNDVYYRVNNRPLGDVVQSFSVSSNKGYIVVNNSQKVEVVNMTDFASLGIIPASYPRYLLPVSNDKAYLTNGAYPGEVLVINTNTLEVTDTIPVGNQPEHIILAGDRAFVANGKWGNDNTVSVIDTFTNEVVQTIEVGDGPTDLISDVNGDVWVLCQGKVTYNDDWTQIISETDSKLVRINRESMEVDKSLIMGLKGDFFSPSVLAVGPDGESLYYIEAGGLYRYSILDNTLPAAPIIATSLNGVAIDPRSGNIYGLEAKGFTSSGELHIYSANGALVATFSVGIAPNGAVFY